MRFLIGKRSSKASAAIRTEYGGRVYASRAEARYAAQLELRRRSGEVLEWRPQIKIPLHAAVHGQRSASSAPALVGHYVADFEVVVAIRGSSSIERRREFHEVKAWPTDLWTWKRRHVAAQYPDVRMVVVNSKGEEMSPAAEREMALRTRRRAEKRRAGARGPGPRP